MSNEVARVRPTTSATPAIMGVLNVTPDSFSDGGKWSSADAAIEHGIELHEAGADIIDVGGESTRPGAERVPTDEEQSRVIPVITELASQGISVSVDTMNSETALAAAQAGASIINDVSGGLADPEMYRVVAQTGLHYIAMHWRGGTHDPATLDSYDDVVADVRTELKARIAELIVWGVDPAKVIIDPGLGFAKTGEHNWKLLGHLNELTSIGYPVLVGASRKRFLATLVADGAPTEARDEPTAIITALAAQAGAWGVRVHDVRSTRLALEVWTQWNAGATG
ncbi:MAG: dihydropteroate synthase [Rhodoglobus sp.]